jgi:uncharacterized membrane-anchored protein
MDKKKIIFTLFIVVVLVQIYVPAKMILNREDILKTGTEFRFKTAPVDPNDPFRGKFINLHFEETEIDIENESDWVYNETIYVIIEADDEGFARIQSVSKEEPFGNKDYVKVKAGYVSGNGEKKLSIDYPFNRFYMEESKAGAAEVSYRKSQVDTNQVTWALVSVKEGEAVLKDVLIDGVSIVEIARNEDME